ncbi:MAG TPA: 50S ribosomal protein L15, partial [Armatimonadetes bacterium]|nr:50S ribosomal protein L15 [Armatimonadota bacterium]
MLHEMSPNPGSTKRRRRVGRGIGSGMGKTCTRGTKGQKARRQISPWFEGGQTPIHRRLPVKKGFRNVNHKE